MANCKPTYKGVQYPSLEAIKSVIKAEREKDIRFQIIGERGASKVEQYQKSLNQAKALDKQGVPTSEIEKQTGWYKNEQGQWKYFSNEILNEFLDISQRRNETVNLIELLKPDSVLLKAYPELNNVKVEFYEGTKGADFRGDAQINGTVTKVGETTILHARTDGEGASNKSRILLHELNHELQRVEQFARGGSPRTFLKIALFITNSENLTSKEAVNKINNFDTTSLNKDDKKIIEIAKEYFKNYPNLEQLLEDSYFLLQGEIDSRAVELALELKSKFGKDTNFTYSELVKELGKKEGIDLANEAISIFIDDIVLSKSPNNTQEVIDKLKQNGLSEDVFLLSTEEINAKLIELEVDADVRRQVIDYKNGYYSNANVAFTNLKDKNVKNVQGWMKALTDVQKNGGIKNVNQELEWIGLEDYLNDYVKENNPKAGNIPSSAVEDYIKSNQIEIVDVSVPRTENPVYGMNDTFGDVQYSGYQLKGAENYRVLLLTMPGKKLETAIEQLLKEYGFNDMAINLYKKNYVDLSEKQKLYVNSEWDKNNTEQRNKEFYKKIDNARKASDDNERNQYESSHWSEKNILAHVRLNEKTLPDGRKVLIVNEIQSDWNQQGKKEGFKTKLVVNAEFGYKELPDGYTTVRRPSDGKILLYKGEEQLKAFDNRDDVITWLENKGVPLNPFVKTDQWVGLVTRRVMQMASQEGYDGIAFATGQQSADMYSLARQADELRYSKNEDGTYNVNILKDSGSINEKKNVPENDLSDYVGKEIAQRIVNNEGEQIENEVSLTGVNLEVGGEGMKTFYDKIVPKAAQKEAQRFDKNAKLETVDFNEKTNVDITKKGRNFVLRVNGEFIESVDGQTLKNSNLENTEEGAKKYFEKYIPQEINADKLSLAKQPYIAITDKMKSELSQGIPQFSKSLNNVGINLITNGLTYKDSKTGKDIVILNKDTATDETAIHEFSHIFSKWQKENRPELWKKGQDLVKAEIEKTANITVTERVKKQEVDVDDNGESIFEDVKYQEFNIEFSNGARAFGSIKDGVADLTQINAPKGVKGNKTYERLLFELNKLGVNSIRVSLQSADSRKAIDSLIKRSILSNPRELRGISVDEYPTLFDISAEKISAEVSEIQYVISYVKQTQPKLKEGSEAYFDEILQEFISRESRNMMDDQKAKSPLMQWLSDFWEEIRKMLSLTSMTPEQVANLNLKEFARASVVDLLKGERIRKEAQEYFTRNADRLPLTLAVFSRPEFKDLQGKMVNPQTVINYLNQSGIKQIEKDLIKQVIEQNYQRQKKISYDELEATVRANIMPLERIETSSYANYGMDNLGDGNYGEAKTLILNAPIEHGVTGHFSGDFKASGRKNIKYQPKQLDANTWVAVEEGYESQANNNNIYQYVGTAGTKEAVDAWIENYNNPERVNNKSNTKIVRDTMNGEEVVILLDSKDSPMFTFKLNEFENENDLHKQVLEKYNGLYSYPQIINKGMFGHIRVWEDDDTFYVAELQSDYFQKNNAKKEFLQKYSGALTEYNLETNDRFNELDNQEKDKIKQYLSDNNITIEEIPTERDGKYIDLKKGDYTIVSNFRTATVSGQIVPLFSVVKDIIRSKKQNYLQNVIDEKTLNEIEKLFDAKKEKTDKLLKLRDSEKSKIIESKFTTQEKQFIASQKEWEKRMVREAIKEASLSGATSLRFPTPYTLSVIEGYITIEEEDKAKSVLRGAVDGEIIDYLDSDYIVMYTDVPNGGTEVQIAPIRELTKINYEEFQDMIEEDGEPDTYVESSDGEFVYYTNSLYNITETIDTKNVESNKESFSIENDLSDTQQTVARKYEEIAQILKTERGDNFETVTDENGFDWYETKIEASETQNPVIAFSKSMSNKVNDYLTKINKVKKENPQQYWSVDVPSYEVVKEAVENDRLVDVNGGMGLVTADGTLIGMFKYDNTKKGTAKSVQAARVLKGGIKLDNYDGYLTKLYKENGFRIVSRLKFDEKQAPKDWNKEVHGTPDVVFMVYDPQGKLNIEEKTFDKDSYEEAQAYRDSFVEEAKNGKTFTQVSEPKATFNGFTTYSEAVKNTPINDAIKVDIAGVNVGEITNNGDINDLVRQDILEDKRELSPNGDIVFVTRGGSLAKKLINAEISKEIIKGRVNEEGNIISRQKTEKTEVSKEFAKNKKEFGQDIALTILGSQIIEENTPTFGKNRIIDHTIEIPSENVLMTKLKNLLQELGIKTMSLETWAENYEKRTGAQPTSNALADISNKIIAFANGEVTQDALTEEVMHFVIEALPQEEIQPLLDMIHKTNEWKEYAQQYTEIYKDDAVVRREILGKVLKNRIQGKAEQSTLQGQSVTRRLAELINKFFEKVRGLFKPQHQQRLDNFTEEIYQKLMAEELYSELSPEQFDGNKLVMYQAVQSPLHNHLSKVLDTFKKLDSSTGNNFQYQLDDIKLKEFDNLNQLKAASGLVATIKSHIAHLDKRGKQKGFLSTEETFVYKTIEEELQPALGMVESVIRSEDMGVNNELKRRVLSEIEDAKNQVDRLISDLRLEKKEKFKELAEKAAEQAGLTEAMTSVLIKEMETLDRDTNQFYALFGGTAHAQNPILNIFSTVMSKVNRESNLQFTRRQNELLNIANKLGFKDEDVAKVLKKFKDGYHFLSPYDYEALFLEEAKIKADIYNSITGNTVTPEEIVKTEEEFKVKLTQDQLKEYMYQTTENIRRSGLYIDVLKKEEREKIETLTDNFSPKTKNRLNELSARKRKVFRRAQDNGGLSSEDNYELQQIMHAQQKLSSPYDEEGNLFEGLELNDDNDVSLAQGIKVEELEPEVRTAYELNFYNQKRREEFSNGDAKAPMRFIEEFSNIKKEQGLDKAIEFLKLNSRISYNSNFWDSFDKAGGIVEKLKDNGETDIAEQIVRQRIKLKNILKQHRMYNNPSQINFEEMSGTAIADVKGITTALNSLYREAKTLLPEEVEELTDSLAETVVNEAYLKEIKDLGLTTLDSKLDFIYQHTTALDKESIQRSIINYKRYKNGDIKNLPKAFTKFDSKSEEENILDYAQSKLLPYFKELKPQDLNLKEFVEEIANVETEDEFNKVIKDAKYISISPAYIWLDAETSDRLNPEYTKRREANEPLVNLEYKGGVLKNKKYQEYFGVANGVATKNDKEFTLLQEVIKFQEATIDSAGMESKHNKYQLPQFRRQSMARIAQVAGGLSGKNIKEAIKDAITIREDDPILGQTIDGQDSKNFQRGALAVPRMGFRKLESSEEVTDEILYSVMLMAKESEKRKQRIGALLDIESIRTELQGKQYGDKSGESTTTYKMFDDFVRYNIYGQTETFKWETDFFGLSSRKHNLAPAINQFQGWVRLVNLAFSVLTPMTSLLQGTTNFMVEKFVGDRLDKVAASQARKKVPKLVTEAASEFLNVRAKGELNLMLQYFGIESPLERYKNSNYGKAARGLAIDKSAYFTHYMGDLPLTAQTVMTVLHDFKVVKGELINYSEWRNRNRSLVEKDARALWAKEEKTAYSYLETKDNQMEMNSKFFSEVKNAEERLNFLKNRIQTAKQEIDNQISQEDKSSIQRHAIFSFFSLHRGFLISSLAKRTKSRHLNLYTGQAEEGTYLGTFNFLAGMIKDARSKGLKQAWLSQYKEYDGEYKKVEKGGKFYIFKIDGKKETQIGEYDSEAKRDEIYKDITSQMTRMRQISVKRAMADVAIVNTLALLALLMKNIADDDDDDYGNEFLAYASYRLATEVAGQSTGLPAQVYQFLESPSVGLAQIQNAIDVFDLANDEQIKQGNYRGMSKRQAWIFKSLPLMKEYNKVHNIDRTRNSYEHFNSVYIENFSFAGAMMDDKK